MTTTAANAPTTTDWIALAREVGLSLRPEVAENDRTGVLSAAAFKRLKDAGLTRALVPAEFGGGGVTHAEMGAILRELARHDPATSLALSMHTHLVAAQVWRQKHGLDSEPVLRKVADGAILISTGASDWIPSNGTARKVDGGFRVSARKGPASGCEVGTILVTSIRWDDAPDGPQVFHTAIPFASEGVSIDLTWDTLGMRATGSHTVVLDDVFVPEASIALMRPADDWHPVFNMVVGAALPIVMSAYLGVADAAVDCARDAVAGRTDPHIFQLFGEMMNAHTTGADVLAASFAEADNLQFANTDDVSSRGLSRKTVITDALIHTVRLAIEVTGGIGFTRSSDIERLYRDVHGGLFHPLPRAKQTQFTGRVELGLSPTS